MRKSYRDVTLKEMVQATNLSKGAFYHYFESKEQLFKEVMDMYLGQYAAEFALTTYKPDSLEDFIDHYSKASKKFVDNIHNWLGKDLTGFNMYRMMFDAIAYYPGFHELVDNYHQTEFNAWVEMINKAKENDEIKKDIDTTRIAKLFIYFYDGFGMRRMMDNNFENFETTSFQVMMEVYDQIKL
jgi:AcrR family transcriptional regulator